MSVAQKVSSAPLQAHSPTAEAFDVHYYATEYPDIALPADELYAHFMTLGWIEGRNPNAHFDTVFYLLQYPDIASAPLNPLAHFLHRGRREGRVISPAVSPLARSALVLGYEVHDWPGRLRQLVDTSFYRKALPSWLPQDLDVAAHFAFRGWREGRDPAPGQHTAQLVQVFAHAAGLLLNPFVALQEHSAGRYKPLQPPPPTLPAQSQGDLLLGEFDATYYSASYPEVVATGLDPLEHFCQTGWREGRNPRASFDTAYYLETHADVREAGINPFWHYIAAGRKEGRSVRGVVGPAAVADHASTSPLPGPPDADVAALVATEFSPAYYLSQYPDVQAAGLDPLLHYLATGWREGRNPCRGFDTRYYLESNVDVDVAGVNPFWHFLSAGRAEGRPGIRPGGYRRRILDAAKEPAERTRGYLPVEGELLSARVLKRNLEKGLAGQGGLAVSLSHDCYVRVIGGTQIFIADEERGFRKRGFAYLHISPRLAKLTLAERDPNFEVQLVLNGEILGLTRLKALAQVLSPLAEALENPPQFLVHSLLGFDPVEVSLLRKALRPGRSLIWLHDFTILCEGFNLLRNDLEHCHAPPPNSIACRMCVYGHTRSAHLARMEAFLDGTDFEVVAPSASTLELWRTRSPLPQRTGHVHPHWELEPAARATRSRARKGPVRVAYVGYPSPNKGWDIFVRLVEEMAKVPDLEFLHFGAKGIRTLEECRFIVAEVTSTDREATQRLLSAHSVDILAILSPWPETFSFVAHEGLLAGCQLLCIEDSGNIAALVRKTGQGRVLKGAEEVLAYFSSGQAVADALKARGVRKSYTARFTGTSATLPSVPGAAQ